jgi:hypothetical protein
MCQNCQIRQNVQNDFDLIWLKIVSIFAILIWLKIPFWVNALIWLKIVFDMIFEYPGDMTFHLAATLLK